MGSKGAKKTTRNRLPTSKTDHITAYLMILPAFAILAVFVLYPLYMAVTKSFTNWSFYGETQFVGFENYRQVIRNAYFQKSLVNSLKFVLILVPSQIFLAFLFAHAVKKLTGGFGTFVKVSIYVPTVIAGVVASVIFIFILDYRAGLVNQMLKVFGLPRMAYANNPLLATIAVCLVVIWLGFGYNTLVFYAGLLNIPKEYYEAAQVDGANAFEQLIKITLPSLKNIFVLVSINLVTGSLQLYDIPYMLTGGGPAQTTQTPMIYLLNNFRDMSKNMGLTLSGAILMMIIIGLCSSVVFRIISSEKSMDA